MWVMHPSCAEGRIPADCKSDSSPTRIKTPFEGRSLQRDSEKNSYPNNTHIKIEGFERLDSISADVDCDPRKLRDVFLEACDMAKTGRLDYEFLFFALHGDNIYKQPTDVRDYNPASNSDVSYHTSRHDYKIHGKIAKMSIPEMMADGAVVCHIYKKDKLVGSVASLADYDYEEAFSLM